MYKKSNIANIIKGKKKKNKIRTAEIRSVE